jgi:DNA repair photolyase
MNVIYEPRGRALEYAYLACNLYGGVCPHRCSYCYIPSATRKSRAQWEATPWYVRKDVIKWLERDAERLSGTDERVLLCFHCDPYSSEAVDSGITRKALQILREFDVPFQVLTKGGMRAAADFDLYGPSDAFATTLTFVEQGPSLEQEPGAATPYDRTKAIIQAHGLGIETWVSLEPVLDPKASLQIIKNTWEWVHLYKVGKLNHDPEAEAKIDWRRFGICAIELCEKHGKRYYIKDDLAKHLKGIEFKSTDTRRVDRGGTR